MPRSADAGFWAGKRVLVTGHTGFKGSWLTLRLATLGARVRGYALAPDTSPSLFASLALSESCEHQLADIRDAAAVDACVAAFRPDVVFHLAAQSLVLRSYREPAETFAVNVHGTVNVLEACRRSNVRAVVAITSDKCYLNREWLWPYREDEPLGGDDPYSASKAAAELVVRAWQRSFFGDGSGTVLASARAGNIFGGGDWSESRLLPDAARAFSAGRTLIVRRPDAVRPWQHVTAALAGYLLLAERLWTDGRPFAMPFNFGPPPQDVLTVRDLVGEFAAAWGGKADIREAPDPAAPHEAAYLTLDSTRARTLLGWRPGEDLRAGLAATAAWYKAFYAGASAPDLRKLAGQAWC